MQNCYNGFVPDMKRLLDYADYYADLMYRNGMDAIGFDGFESTVYQNHGYYAVRIFCRRLFETYARLTGGKVPRVTGSNVFTGAWEYMNACNVGGGITCSMQAQDSGVSKQGHRQRFQPQLLSRHLRIQNWYSEWSVYDAEKPAGQSHRLGRPRMPLV